MKALVLLAGTMLAFVAAPAAAQGGVDPGAAAVVERLQGLVGTVRRNALRFANVHGEGRTVVIEIEILVGAPDMVQPPLVPGPIMTSLCAEPGAAGFLFADGRTIRVQVSRGGRTASTTYDRCPPQAGEGFTAAAFATSMQAAVGTPLDRGAVIGAIRAQGDTVVITVDAPAGLAREAAGEALAFVGGFCQTPDSQTQFFDRGLSMRMDVVPRGEAPIVGHLFTTCPGR